MLLDQVYSWFARAGLRWLNRDRRALDRPITDTPAGPKAPRLSIYPSYSAYALDVSQFTMGLIQIDGVAYFDYSSRLTLPGAAVDPADQAPEGTPTLVKGF